MWRVPQRSKPPTLATLAKAVGVSPATVSNAFNHPEKLSAALRITILETAERLRYGGPDPRAASLRRGRAGTIGVIVPDRLSYAFSDPAVVSVMDGLAEVLDGSNIALLLLAGNADRRGPAAGAVQTAAVDGFVLYGGVEDDELANALQRRRLPVIALGGVARSGRSLVDLDEESGSRALAQYLVDLGHRRFGIVTLRCRNDALSGPLSAERRRVIEFSTTQRRLEAVLTTLGAAGVDVDAVPIFEVAHNHPEEGKLAAHWLLSQRKRPTAVICQSDQIAVGVLEGIHELGLRIPEDVSVGGFDDIDLARRTIPALTTIRQPLRERGRLVGQMMLKALDGHRARSVMLPTELVVRASTGRVKRRQS